MTHSRLTLILGLGLLLPACGDDGSTAEGGSGSSDTGGSEGTTTSPTTTTTTTAMTDSVGTMSGTGSTTSDTTTTGPADSTGTTEATTSPATETGGSSSGGMGATPYPPCMAMDDPPCPDPYDHCYPYVEPDFTVCSQMCTDDADCPQPDSGDAPAVCGGPMADECVLDCAGGAICPDGMECVQVAGGGGGGIFRCAWPV